MAIKYLFRSNPAYRQQRIDLRLAMFGLFICVYLIWPSFGAVHVEGFSAQIESIALLKSYAPQLEHDPYLPLITQFIFETRSAVIDLLAMIYKLFPNAGDVAFQGLILASFMLLLYSSVVFAKRWGNVPVLFGLFALILTQGIPETAFFFNDNMVSAAFAVFALSIIAHKPQLFTLLLSGLALAIALLARLDAVFIVPLLAGTLCLARNSILRGSLAFLIICMTTVAVLIIQYCLQGFSLLDTLDIGQKFAAKMLPISWKEWFLVRVFFFGVVALALFMLGASIFYGKLKTQKAYLAILTFIVYPLALIFFAPKASQVRYIFPLLSPLVALHVGTGLQWIYGQVAFGHGKKATLAKAFTVLAVIIFISPPTALLMMDGPRAILGRVWSPVQWLHWQDSVNLSLDRTQAVVSSLDNNQVNMLVSTHWNDEFYSRLKLIEAGFTPHLASSLYAGCKGFSVFTKGNSVVIHIRTNTQYFMAPLNVKENAALQLTTAFKCHSIQPFKVIVSAVGQDGGRVSPEIYGFTNAIFPDALTDNFFDTLALLHNKNRIEVLVGYKELSASEIVKMQAFSAKYFLEHPQFDKTTGKKIDIDQYNKYYLPIHSLTDKLLHDVM
jgi:hypothetical protein